MRGAKVASRGTWRLLQRIARWGGVSIVTSIILVMTSSCTPSLSARHLGALYLKWARFAHGLIIVGVESRTGKPSILVYDEHLHFIRRIAGAIFYKMDYNGRYLSFFSDQNRPLTFRTRGLSRVMPQLPRFPYRDIPWTVVPLTPTVAFLRIHVNGKRLLGLCDQGEPACDLGPPPPCQVWHRTFHRVDAMELPDSRGYALVAGCSQFASRPHPTIDNELLGYSSRTRQWKILESDDTRLRAWWSMAGWRIAFAASLHHGYQILQPIPDSDFVEVKSFNLETGTSHSRRYRVPTAAPLGRYRFLSPRVELAILTNPEMALQAARRRFLDADRRGRYLYVHRGVFHAHLCEQRGGEHSPPICTGRSFRTGTLKQVYSARIGGHFIYYEITFPPDTHGRTVLYVHGGPAVQIYRDQFRRVLSDTRYIVVTPLFTGGKTKFRQLEFPDLNTLDPRIVADEVAAVWRSASQRFALKGRPIVVSQSFGGFVAQLLAGRGFSAAAYISFAGFCSPSDFLAWTSRNKPWLAGNPLLLHMIARHESGCGGFKKTEVPVIGFVHREDHILGRNGVIAFSQAIRAAPHGRIYEAPGTAHVVANVAEAVSDLDMAFKQIGNGKHHSTQRN